MDESELLECSDCCVLRRESGIHSELPSQLRHAQLLSFTGTTRHTASLVSQQSCQPCPTNRCRVMQESIEVKEAPSSPKKAMHVIDFLQNLYEFIVMNDFKNELMRLYTISI